MWSEKNSWPACRGRWTGAASGIGRDSLKSENRLEWRLDKAISFDKHRGSLCVFEPKSCLTKRHSRQRPPFFVRNDHIQLAVPVEIRRSEIYRAKAHFLPVRTHAYSCRIREIAV